MYILNSIKCISNSIYINENKSLFVDKYITWTRLDLFVLLFILYTQKI